MFSWPLWNEISSTNGSSRTLISNSSLFFVSKWYRDQRILSDGRCLHPVFTEFPLSTSMDQWIDGAIDRFIERNVQSGIPEAVESECCRLFLLLSSSFRVCVCVCVCVCVGGFVLCCHFFVSLTLDLLFLFHCNGRVMAPGGRNHQQQWRHAVDFSFSNLFHRFIVLSLSLSLSLSNTHTLGSTTRAFAKLGKTDMVNKEP